MTHAFRQWLQLLTLAAFALLVLGVAAPGQLKAACGDYVTVGGKKASMTPHDAIKPNAPPCHGPNCSQNPTAPVVPPAPPPTVTFGEWANLLVRLADPFPTRRSLVVDGNAAHPIHHSDPIFHPPRLSA